MQPTLSSALEGIQARSDVPPDKNHPFASGSEDSYVYLQQISQAADTITGSLNAYLSLPRAQPKLISLLRQQSTLECTIQKVRHPPRFLSTHTVAHLMFGSQKDGQSSLSMPYRTRPEPFTAKTFHWILLS
jgi:hypothetical protein